MNLKSYILAIVFIIASVCSFASDYKLTNIGAKGELKDNYVHCLYKDSDGFIWVGTGTTIERWDGIQSMAYPFPEYNLEYTPYLVNSILEREPHEYWVGCRKGLWKANIQTQQMEQQFPDQISFPVYSLAKDEDNHLYIGTENGLYIYDGTGLTHIRIDPENRQTKSNNVVKVEVTGKDRVWMMTADGLASCNPQTKAIKFYPNTLPGCGSLLSMTRVDRKFYIGTEKNGILTFDTSNNGYSSYWNRIQAPVSALSYENNTLAIATLGQGIHLFSLTDNKPIYANTYTPDANKELASNDFSSILLSNGTVWCGMDYYTGMIKLRKASTFFNLYSSKHFNSAGIPVRNMLLTDNQLFISNRDGFVCIKNQTEEVHYINTRTVGKEKLRSDLIFSFYEYDGHLLIGTYKGGISAMNPDTYAFTETPLTQTLAKNDIFMFLEDKKHNLWIAASDGLYCYDKLTKTIKEYNAFNSGMPGNMVYSICIDSSGRFWLATNRGVTLFNPDTGKCSQKMLPEKSAILNEPVRSIYEGKDGTLFFCVLKRPLYVIDKHLKNPRTPIPVECGNVCQDQNGSYWLVNHLGILKMNEELTSYNLFTSADGLPDGPMSSGAVILKDKNNHLWMANMKGLIIVNPNSDIYPSPLKVIEIKVNGEQLINSYQLQPGKSFSFTREENNLTFRFVSLGYENPDVMKYEYMLEGLDSTWISLDHENKVAYYNLAPGSYTFKVRKLLNEDSMASVSFEVEGGISLSMILLVLTILAVGGSIALFIRKQRRPLPTTSVAEEKAFDLKEEKKEELAATAESYVKLSNAEVEKMTLSLKAYMEEGKPYLNVDLKQSEVAVALGYSTYLLSALFTHYLKVGYYDYVNTYRIEEFKSRVKAGDYKKYTLLTLAEQCGFKSKTSFFRSFKKRTGLTPNEYIQQHTK